MPPDDEGNPPGFFHRLTGVPFSHALRPHQYKDTLKKDFTTTQEHIRDIDDQITKSGQKIDRYQTTAREHKHALRWAFGKAVLHGVVDQFGGGFYLEEFAVSDVNETPFEMISVARKNQTFARDVAPKKIIKHEARVQDLKTQRIEAEAKLKRLNVQLEVSGFKAAL